MTKDFLSVWTSLLSVVLFATLLCSAQEQHLRPPASPIPKTYFGLHIHRAATTTPWPTVPFGSLRLWDTYTTRADLEPQKRQMELYPARQVR